MIVESCFATLAVAPGPGSTRWPRRMSQPMAAPDVTRACPGTERSTPSLPTRRPRRPSIRGPLLLAPFLGSLLTAFVFPTRLIAVEPADDPRWHQELSDLRGAVPPDEILLRHGAVIGDIFVQTNDIFDPEKPDENRFAFRFANRLHITTRPPAIERKLLFRRGDPYDPRVLAETERYLRSLDFLYDADIVPIRYQGNRVDLLVTTRDVWTLSTGAGFKRSGGANTFQAHLEESNLLGTGRVFELKYADDPDRRSSRLRYIDQALFDTRTELRLWYADNSDGYRQVFDLARPFFSLDTRWSAAIKWISDQRLERLYSQGEVVERFVHVADRVEIRGGLSSGYHNGRTRRWSAGFTFERSQFRDEFSLDPPVGDDSYGGYHPPGSVGLPNDRQPSTLPPSGRQLSYFWVGFEQVEDGFVTLENMDQINRSEDFNLGHEWHARIGWSDPTWGGDESQAIVEAQLSSGWKIRSRQNLFLDGWASGRWGSGGSENVLAGAELRYYFRNFGPHRLHITLRADAAWNLDPEKQLLLGGDSGLRGYPRRFQDGDRRFLVSIEQRFYTPWELFNLVHVGAAIFADAGRAWYEAGEKGLGTLRDVGFGLRLGSSRSSKGQMVHLDVAFPLDGDEQEIQWLVTTQRTF